MKKHNLTQGPIFSNLLLFALPMMMGNLLQQVYNITDSILVGRLIGADALAAVGSAYTLMTFLTSVIIGLCMGSGALFSADYGAGKKDQFQKDAWHSFLFLAVITILIIALIYPSMNLILQMLQIPGELYTLSADYVRIIFAGIAFTAVYNYYAYLLRSVGNSVIPLVFLGVSSVLNIILDCWFIIGFAWGVAGAAFATVIAQAVSGIGIMTYAWVRIPGFRFSSIRSPFDGHRMLYIIENDIMTAMQQAVMNFGILMIQGLVNSFGSVTMAAFAAAVKIDTLAYMPAQEYANAYSLFVSQNYGAGRQERIRRGSKMAVISSGLFCLCISIFVNLTASGLMSIFVNAGETEILAAGVRYLRIEGACYIGIGILFLWYGYFRGIAKPEVSFLLTVISLGTRVLLSYTLAPHTPLGVTAIWCSIPIGWFLADAAGLLLYIRGRKL